MDKLNKYLIKIINEYTIPNINELIKETPKEFEDFSYVINPHLTIDDMLIKCLHKGYQGFFISKSDDCIIIEIDGLLTEDIEKIDDDYICLYKYKQDQRIMHYIDIKRLENVISESHFINVLVLSP